MNCTNENNNQATTETTPLNPTNPTNLPYRATLHPTLRALWSIPHIIRIPDPMPAPPDVLELLQNQLAIHETQLAPLDWENEDHKPEIAGQKSYIAILKHKIEELHRAFPELNDPEGRAKLSQLAASAPATSNNQPLVSAPTPPTNNETQSRFLALNAPTEPTRVASTIENENKNSSTPEPGQIPQTPPSQQIQTRTQPAHIPDDPGSASTQSGLTSTQPEIAQTRPAQSAHTISAPPAPSSSPQHADAHNDAFDDPPTIDSTNEAFVEAATDLHYQLKGRSRFDKLSVEQQASIINLMDVHETNVVLELLASPPPTGMSFKIGRSALYAFRRRYQKREAQRRLDDKNKIATDVLCNSSNPKQAFLEMYERLLHIKALTTASDPETSLETLDAITTTINKLRKQSLAERKQAYAEEQGS